MFVKWTLDLAIGLCLDIESPENIQRAMLGGAAVGSGFHTEQGACGCLVNLLAWSAPLLLHVSAFPNLLCPLKF